MILSSLFRPGQLCAYGFRLGYVYSGKRLASVDDVAAHFGLRRLGREWIEMTRDEAALVIVHVLGTSLPHGTSRLSHKDAQGVATAFLAVFSVNTKFVSNCRWFDDASHDAISKVSVPPQFESGTDATFDGGVIGFSESISGVLWLEDED